MNFNIIVQNKIAAPDETAPVIVCGNNGYVIDFIFDSEWDEYEIKNAVFNFKRNGKKKTIEVVFTGTQCNVPILSGIDEVEIGVYAGELQTTTPAKFACRKSALCDVSKIEDVPKDVYSQLLELLKNHYPLETAIEAKNAADYAYNQIEKANQLIKKTFVDIYATLADKIDGQYISAMVEGTTLWENPNPTEEFPAQTIALDLAQYDRIAVTADDYNYTEICYEKNTDYKLWRHFTDGAVGRTVSFNDEGVSIGSYSAGMSVNNSLLIPLKIVGYKKYIPEETPSIEHALDEIINVQNQYIEGAE